MEKSCDGHVKNNPYCHAYRCTPHIHVRQHRDGRKFMEFTECNFGCRTLMRIPNGAECCLMPMDCEGFNELEVIRFMYMYM